MFFISFIHGAITWLMKVFHKIWNIALRINSSTKLRYYTTHISHQVGLLCTHHLGEPTSCFYRQYNLLSFLQFAPLWSVLFGGLSFLKYWDQELTRAITEKLFHRFDVLVCMIGIQDVHVIPSFPLHCLNILMVFRLFVGSKFEHFSSN